LESRTRLILHSKIRDINFEYDKLIVGSSLEALVYSYLHNIPLVCSRLAKPWRFDFFEPDYNLEIFNLKNIIQILNSPDGEKGFGLPKNILWEKLYFYLSLAGLCPLSDKANSLRIENKILKATTNRARMAQFHFNELIVFDDHNLLGDITTQKSTDHIYKVYDWLNVRSGMKHEYDFMDFSDEFVNKIVFYNSDRIDGSINFKDAVAISYLKNKQLHDYEFSDINARFKTLYLMKEAGIRGARNGRDMLDKTRFKYYAVKIETDRREIVPPKIYWNSTETIKFNYDSIDDIMGKTEPPESYVRRITK
jgi:hypothetical protein